MYPTEPEILQLAANACAKRPDGELYHMCLHNLSRFYAQADTKATGIGRLILYRAGRGLSAAAV